MEVLSLFSFKKKNEMFSPVTGKSISLESVNDDVFSKKMMGEGIAFEPTSEIVVSPCKGTVSLVMSSKHAVGITMDNGAEILIHVGLDTVELNGEGFESLVKEMDKVKVGQPLLKFDKAFIEAKGLETTTMLISTNNVLNIKKIVTDINVEAGITSIIEYK